MEGQVTMKKANSGTDRLIQRILLIMAMLLLFIRPITVQAGETKTYGDYKYCYNEEYEGIEITKYNGKEKNIVVPETIDGIAVKVIGYRAFKKGGVFDTNKYPEQITLPDSVIKIGEEAFDGCINLKKVNLPKKLCLLGEWAFCDCESLETIKIPDTLNVISEAAFADTGLKKIVIPANITQIGESSFAGCSKLEKIVFAKKSKLKSIGFQAFISCDNLKTVSFPSSLEMLDGDAFRNCGKLKKVEFATNSKLKRMESGCFQYCDTLSKITIPRNVKYIGASAFDYCIKLKSITFKGKVPSIKQSAFKTIDSNATFKVPAKYKSKYKKKLAGRSWYKMTMRIV